MKLFKIVKVQRSLGLHLRDAANLIKVIQKFHCRIKVQKGDARVDGRSLLGLLTLEAREGTELAVYIDGADALEALEAIRKYLEEGLLENINGPGVRPGPTAIGTR